MKKDLNKRELRWINKHRIVVTDRYDECVKACFGEAGICSKEEKIEYAKMVQNINDKGYLDFMKQL